MIYIATFKELRDIAKIQYSNGKFPAFLPFSQDLKMEYNSSIDIGGWNYIYKMVSKNYTIKAPTPLNFSLMQCEYFPSETIIKLYSSHSAMAVQRYEERLGWIDIERFMRLLAEASDYFDRDIIFIDTCEDLERFRNMFMEYMNSIFERNGITKHIERFSWLNFYKNRT